MTKVLRHYYISDKVIVDKPRREMGHQGHLQPNKPSVWDTSHQKKNQKNVVSALKFYADALIKGSVSPRPCRMHK